jgi:hypothetical protein
MEWLGAFCQRRALSFTEQDGRQEVFEIKIILIAIKNVKINSFDRDCS